MKEFAWVKLGVLLIAMVGVWGVGRALGIDIMRMTPERMREVVVSFGAWAPLVYLLVYGQPIVPLPASVMTALAGAAFGKGWGMLAAVGGTTVRACTQFLIARLLGREVVARLLKGKIAALDRRLGEDGLKAVLLIRLIPNFPYDIQNYGLGFSQVRAVPYVVATVLGIIPGSLAYVYLGDSLTDLKQIWKLFLAMLIIVGLMAGRWVWNRKTRMIADHSADIRG